MRNWLPAPLSAMAALVLAAFVPAWVFAQGYPPDEAAAKMTVAGGFEVSLVASEPDVRQPVCIEFDDRARLWVVQYLQYPNPAGLTRVKVDRYSRTVYDRVPEPPPKGPRGADRITILEDADFDGRYETARDFVDGLNLATGLAIGHGGVFVLNVPYLLFYPDRDGNDVPDGDPEVLLTGFGMEDTSSLANSLTWGPDGWLYGTQGTNITARIRGIEFEQGVWRYHPITREFELFCEGGGNPWGLDFDRDGNLFFSTNHGGFVMHHGVQGAYYAKSFAKHGELHNPFAFGYFDHVPHADFHGGHVTVGGLIYQGDSFPGPYRGTYVAADLLGHAVNWHSVVADGSTFRTAHGGALATANDTWFAPSDCTLGPDGAVYVADWHDQRTAHPDPDASWDRSNGRVFRIQGANATPQPHENPNHRSSAELVGWLERTNGWHIRRALRVLAERRDGSVVEPLRKLAAESPDERVALNAVWGLYVSGGLDEAAALALLRHRAPAVRSWTVRLLGDAKSISPPLRDRFVSLAYSERSPIVASQLAATAKRLPAEEGLAIALGVASGEKRATDPYIPLLCWWAVEAHALADVDAVVTAFTSDNAWQRPIIRDVILGRLVKRYAAAGMPETFAACARIIDSAPDAEQKSKLLVELESGLAMIGASAPTHSEGLPLGGAFSRIAEVRDFQAFRSRRLEQVPAELAGILKTVWSPATSDPFVLRLSARLGGGAAIDRALTLAADAEQSVETRIAMLDLLNELGEERALPVLLAIVEGQTPEPLRIRAFEGLGRFTDDAVAAKALSQYGAAGDPVKFAIRTLLFGRPEWARLFLDQVETGAIPPQSVPVDELRRVALHQNEELDAIVRKHWGNIRAGTPEEKLAEIRRLGNDLRAGTGDLERGQALFKQHCATCHRLFGEGNQIGPDLTTANRTDQEYLLASLVDPSSQIRKEFLSYVVVMNDGRIVTGLIAEQTPASITLVGAKNERTTIAREDIDVMNESPVSLMPEKVISELKPQEVRDLFRYLQKPAP